MKISICIPTYNRAEHLKNCLHSIILNPAIANDNIQICVSDNCSTDETEKVVRHAQNKIRIKYDKKIKNYGMARNILKAVEMADGEFVWLLGDDDLLLTNALEQIYNLVIKYPDIDFFYVNSFHLSTEYVLSYPQPFNTTNLPNNMKPFSPLLKNCEMKFMDLIDPNISFDFLGGIYLSIFRRQKWLDNINALNNSAMEDSRVFSHFDNTFPHITIFAQAFSDSKAFFYAQPLSVNLHGAREWAPMSPLINSVRLPEALDQYRKNGLPFIKYIKYKNYTLHSLVPDIVKMILHKEDSGIVYVNLIKLVYSSLLYPNLYLSSFRWIAKKMKSSIFKSDN
jgi:glycosyltransferase involved in cell wall biosynthesis